MGMYQNIQDILKILWNDEELLRLLIYPPENIDIGAPDPMNETLSNVTETDEDWTHRKSVIMLTPKDDDLFGDKKCILFAYLGDREPSRGNYQTANQEINFDVFCHADYENEDMRSSRIADRLNDLFALQHVTGIGKTDFVGTRIISRSPAQYVGYQHKYAFGGTKR